MNIGTFYNFISRNL